MAETTQACAQIFLIRLTTAPTAALDFRRSIAGSVELFFVAATWACVVGMRRGHASWAAAGATAGAFVVPAVMGNVVGGVTFVAMLNHGQVCTAVVARARKKR